MENTPPPGANRVKAIKCLIRYFNISLEYGTIMIVTERMTNVLLSCDALNSLIVTLRGHLNRDQLRGRYSIDRTKLCPRIKLDG